MADLGGTVRYSPCSRVLEGSGGRRERFARGREEGESTLFFAAMLLPHAHILCTWPPRHALKVSHGGSELA